MIKIEFKELMKLLHAATGNVKNFAMDNEGFVIEFLKLQNLNYSKLTSKNTPNIGDMILYEGNSDTPQYGEYIGENKVKLKSGKIDLFDRFIISSIS